MTKPTSVITMCVCQVARCGDQSAYLYYNCRFNSGSKEWLEECIGLSLLFLL